MKHTLASKPQYRKVTAVPAEDNAKDVIWERQTLHVLNLHMKSKLPADIEGQKKDNYTWKTASAWAESYFISSMKRVGQALEVRMLVDKIFDDHGEDSFVDVCGDYNADSDSVPVNAIRGSVENTGNPDLSTRVMIPCEGSVSESSRYSLIHHGRGEMIDHILVSRSLLGAYRGTEIHNEALPDESGASRTDVKFPESDHAPVVAEFVL